MATEQKIVSVGGAKVGVHAYLSHSTLHNFVISYHIDHVPRKTKPGLFCFTHSYYLLMHAIALAARKSFYLY